MFGDVAGQLEDNRVIRFLLNDQIQEIEKLAEIDPNELSPMEALRELAKLKELLNQERNNKSYR